MCLPACFFSAPLTCEIHHHLLQMILNPDKSDRSKASPVSQLRACRDRGLRQEWWHVPETIWLLQQPNELCMVLMSFLIAIISLWFLTFFAHPDARRRFFLLITHLRQWIQNRNPLYNTRCSSGYRQVLLCQSFLICFSPLNELLLVFPLQTLMDGMSFYVAPHEELVMVDALTFFLIIMLHIFVFIFWRCCWPIS